MDEFQREAGEGTGVLHYNTDGMGLPSATYVRYGKINNNTHSGYLNEECTERRLSAKGDYNSAVRDGGGRRNYRNAEAPGGLYVAFRGRNALAHQVWPGQSGGRALCFDSQDAPAR